MIEFDVTPHKSGPCSIEGSSGMLFRNLTNFLLKASVLIPVRVLISTGRQLKRLEPAEVKLSAWIVF